MTTTVSIQDDWTTGALSNVDGRTADVAGSTWSAVEVTGGSGPSYAGRVSTSGFAYSSGGVFGAANATVLGAGEWDISLEVIRPSGSSFPMFRIFADCGAGGAGGYALVIHNYANELRIYRGTVSFSNLGTLASGGSVAHTQPSGTSTYVIQRRNVGANAVIKVFRNATELLSFTDTAPLSSGGRTGFGMDGSGSGDGNLLTFLATYESASASTLPVKLAQLLRI